MTPASLHDLILYVGRFLNLAVYAGGFVLVYAGAVATFREFGTRRLKRP